MKKGITLIEVIIYIALFSLIIGGAVLSVWNTSISTDRGQTAAELEIEGDFLLNKMTYATSSIPTLPGEDITLTYSPASSTAFASMTAHIILKKRTDAGTIVLQDFSRTYYDKK